ncbi:hypothetical protein BDA99DRAFT_513175, partial [Phascolomyces articulosus]
TPSFQEAAQFFQKPSEYQRFQYVHIPFGKRLPHSEIRQYLRSLTINPNRIIDISYPARNVLSLLIHTKYLLSVSLLLRKVNTLLLYEFNPTDPIYLRDPTYISLPKQKKNMSSRTLCSMETLNKTTIFHRMRGTQHNEY